MGRQGRSGAYKASGRVKDPSAVIFDAISGAKARNTDVLICDTAGKTSQQKELDARTSKNI